MAVQRFAFDPGKAARALPELRSRERQHDEREDRDEEQRRFQFGVDAAVVLRFADACGKALQLFDGQTLDHALAQQATFVDDFAQPERRQPGHARGDVEQTRDEFFHERMRVVRRVAVHAFPHEGDRAGDALFDHGVQQLFAIREVVVDHRRRHTRSRGDLRHGGGCDALFAEQLGGAGKQPLAHVEVGVGAASSARAGRGSDRSGGWGGARDHGSTLIHALVKFKRRELWVNPEAVLTGSEQSLSGVVSELSYTKTMACHSGCEIPAEGSNIQTPPWNKK
ncbi:hypothetical protein PUN4_970009 [Paraburkholderia unamae]|nr:hypothetical protein PUN4_970009 [Paraburkholderia unamae]